MKYRNLQKNYEVFLVRFQDYSLTKSLASFVGVHAHCNFLRESAANFMSCIEIAP